MGVPRLWGVHVGVVGLGLNLGLAVLGSLRVAPQNSLPSGRRRRLDAGL
jgi:hypothetical protein